MSQASILPALLLLLLAPGSLLGQRSGEDIRYNSGNIQVRRDLVGLDDESGPARLYYHMILRDQIDFGQCFEDARYRRMPVTYYHPQGPVGLALAKFNWFPGAANTYHADARLPTSFLALGFPCGPNLPICQLTGLWSEPPIAVIGMAAGTPAAYARPFQHFHFYEPNKNVIELNERQGGECFFHFIPEARARGAGIRIFHGPPRQELRKQGPRNFYHLMIVESCSGENGEKIFLDLFTKEGITQCLQHLAEDGVLCVHTSHRFVKLPPVLAAIAKELNLHCRRGHDVAPSNRGGKMPLAEVVHFASEWVLLARQQRVLDAICKTPADYEELRQKAAAGRFFGGDEEYWTTPTPLDQVWTDKGPNLLHGILRGHPFALRYSALARPCTEFLSDALEIPELNSYPWSQLPRPVEEWLVQWQLKAKPRVEDLWP
jgi:hypothetical protein